MSESEKTYEMMWDCEYCGQPKLLGVTHRHCPSCGAPQNPERRYFPPDDEKVAVEDHQYVGADVHCPACRTAQSARVKHCGNCGSPMEEGKVAARRGDQVVGAGGVVQTPHSTPRDKPAKKRGWVGIVLALVALAVGGLIAARFAWKTETGVTVSGHSWVREIEIEQFDEVDEESACASMPSDARNVVRSRGETQCTTRKVDQGDGTFKEVEECTEPEERCQYSLSKWTVGRTLEETGQGLDSTPRWPQVKLARTGDCLGCEREGERNESYLVHFKEAKSNEELRCSFSDAERWKSFAVGVSYAAQKHGLGGDLDCDSLKKAP